MAAKQTSENHKHITHIQAVLNHQLDLGYLQHDYQALKLIFPDLKI